MILPDKKDAVHKAWLYRMLSRLFDDPFISEKLAFKGGTCAAMLGYLDRFSIDLDFDFLGEGAELAETRAHMERVFESVGLTVYDQSKYAPQYFLKYPTKQGERNALKIDATFPPPQANQYEPKRFSEIDRIIVCQTKETMFANKLVAAMERYQKNERIAGRDIYDIHHFFLSGFGYDKDVIRERTKKDSVAFFTELREFVDSKITAVILDQDLNHLLPHEQWKKIRKTLKQEVLLFLRDEVERLHSR